MKKTIIAAAIASLVAAPVMADVKIGGKVEQFQTQGEDDVWTPGSDVRITLSGSEDLGNGMTASFKIDSYVHNRTQTSSTTTAHTHTSSAGYDGSLDQKVALSGGFGTVVMGRFEDFSESAGMSKVDVFQGPGVETSGSLAGRTNGGMAYVSPAMNGLTVGVGGYTGVNDNSDAFDATDIALMYSNGPIAVSLSNEDTDGTSDTTVVGASYTMGDLKIGVARSDTDFDDGSADSTDSMVAATYKMGNNTIVLGWNDDETNGTGVNNTAIELRHNISKRTSVYLNAYNSDTAGSDTTTIGMQHTF